MHLERVKKESCSTRVATKLYGKYMRVCCVSRMTRLHPASQCRAVTHSESLHQILSFSYPLPCCDAIPHPFRLDYIYLPFTLPSEQFLRLVSTQALGCNNMGSIGCRLSVIFFQFFIRVLLDVSRTNMTWPPASVTILFISISVVSRK